MPSPPYVETIALDVTSAADALVAALRAGLDPEDDAPRTFLPVAGGGELLVMPSTAGGAAAVKLIGIGGTPRIQGVCVVFDPVTLAPAALIDGIALTNLRTPAVSQIVVRECAAPDARQLVVFGRGPQGRAHAEAVHAVRPIERTTSFGRDADPADVARAVASADVICCCTTAREPLFDGALVKDGAVVCAVGSHEPEAAELDAALMRRAAVVVESRTSALREAGDVIRADLRPAELHTLAGLVAGDRPPAGAPVVLKTTGMSWQDAVVAAAVVAAI